MSLVVVENRCPYRVWFRVYCIPEVGGFSGHDLAQHDTQEIHGSDSEPYHSIKGMKWERGEAENWVPTFDSLLDDEAWSHKLVLTSLFGLRLASSIKVFMACLAGPADPLTRNDIKLIDRLNSEVGIPRDNTWMFLERQCTPNVIKESLTVATGTCQPKEDFLFVYLGGHGSRKSSDVFGKSGNGYEYVLGTWGGGTSSELVLKAIENAKCPVFMVVDSCHSGQMIPDAKSFFENKSHPTIYILASTQSDNSAQTGWKLIQKLIDHMVDGSKKQDVNATTIGMDVVDTLVTSLQGQKAQFEILPEKP